MVTLLQKCNIVIKQYSYGKTETKLVTANSQIHSFNMDAKETSETKSDQPYSQKFLNYKKAFVHVFAEPHHGRYRVLKQIPYPRRDSIGYIFNALKKKHEKNEKLYNDLINHLLNVTIIDTENGKHRIGMRPLTAAIVQLGCEHGDAESRKDWYKVCLLLLSNGANLSLPLIDTIEIENSISEISFGAIFSLYNRVSINPKTAKTSVFTLLEYNEMSKEQKLLERYLLTQYGSCYLPAIVSIDSLANHRLDYLFHTSKRTLSQNCKRTSSYQRIYHLMQLGLEPVRLSTTTNAMNDNMNDWKWNYNQLRRNESLNNDDDDYDDNNNSNSDDDNSDTFFITIYAILTVFNDMKTSELNKILSLTLKMDHICTLKDVWSLIFDYLYVDININTMSDTYYEIMFDVLNGLTNKRNVLGKRTILGKKDEEWVYEILEQECFEFEHLVNVDASNNDNDTTSDKKHGQQKKNGYVRLGFAQKKAQLRHQHQIDNIERMLSVIDTNINVTEKDINRTIYPELKCGIKFGVLLENLFIKSLNILYNICIDSGQCLEFHKFPLVILSLISKYDRYLLLKRKFEWSQYACSRILHILCDETCYSHECHLAIVKQFFYYWPRNKKSFKNINEYLIDFPVLLKFMYGFNLYKIWSVTEFDLTNISDDEHNGNDNDNDNDATSSNVNLVNESVTQFKRFFLFLFNELRYDCNMRDRHSRVHYLFILQYCPSDCYIDLLNFFVLKGHANINKCHQLSLHDRNNTDKKKQQHQSNVISKSLKEDWKLLRCSQYCMIMQVLFNHISILPQILSTVAEYNQKIKFHILNGYGEDLFIVLVKYYSKYHENDSNVENSIICMIDEIIEYCVENDLNLAFIGNRDYIEHKSASQVALEKNYQALFEFFSQFEKEKNIYKYYCRKLVKNGIGGGGGSGGSNSGSGSSSPAKREKPSLTEVGAGASAPGGAVKHEAWKSLMILNYEKRLERMKQECNRSINMMKRKCEAKLRHNRVEYNIKSRKLEKAFQEKELKFLRSQKDARRAKQQISSLENEVQLLYSKIDKFKLQNKNLKATITQIEKSKQDLVIAASQQLEQMRNELNNRTNMAYYYQQQQAQPQPYQPQPYQPQQRQQRQHQSQKYSRHSHH